MLLDAVVSLAGLVVPGVFDFIKKKFIKTENDTPERTMGSLATTKPEVLPAYTSALASLMQAQTNFFNRDVIGVPSFWVRDLRSAIRPVTVVVGLTCLVLSAYGFVFLEDGPRLFFEAIISSWMGDRFGRK
jgi:hypothetical protein